MPRIEKLMLSTSKDTPVKTPQSAVLIENLGMQGDRYAKEGSLRQISFADEDAIGNELGICTKKFVANFVTSGLDYTQLSVGQQICVSGCTIEVTQIGKSCYDKECPLFGTLGHSCTLVRDCAYGRILKGGTVGVADEIQL